ncbi:MAG: hypothetical protein ACLSAP_07075 [Oscillospiraceae bacterium]
MTVCTLAREAGFAIAAGESAADREVKGVYCCDLLSMVMGRAKADYAWITVIPTSTRLRSPLRTSPSSPSVPVTPKPAPKPAGDCYSVSPLPVLNRPAIRRCIGVAGK